MLRFPFSLPSKATTAKFPFEKASKLERLILEGITLNGFSHPTGEVRGMPVENIIQRKTAAGIMKSPALRLTEAFPDE